LYFLDLAVRAPSPLYFVVFQVHDSAAVAMSLNSPLTPGTPSSAFAVPRPVFPGLGLTVAVLVDASLTVRGGYFPLSEVLRYSRFRAFLLGPHAHAFYEFVPCHDPMKFFWPWSFSE